MCASGGVCRFYLQGKCKFGDGCRNYHPQGRGGGEPIVYIYILGVGIGVLKEPCRQFSMPAVLYIACMIEVVSCHLSRMQVRRTKKLH